ncbi:hypothetical protein FJY84_06990 [Candidatus Bathyarchaeota archaeon]|nr:hypothetical protein [Candidatus Bathyarchaeota archaeon]
MSEPTYWGTWKGRVIKAIAVDGAYSWGEIRDLTGLSTASLNQVLGELYDAKVLTKRDDGQYRVNFELYKEYNNYFKNLSATESASMKTVKITESQQNSLISRIDEWKKFKGLEISLKPQHFYLDGEFLDEFSKDLIKHCTKEVLVVNPYVEKCNLSDSLIQASTIGKEVSLVTRPADSIVKEEYHGFLKASGIDLTYNKSVHAKIMVLDRAIAIVSSMNLYSGSTAGTSWEAGLISIESSVVESVINSIRALLEKPESKSYN